MAQPIKVGVIGAGGIAQMMHLPFLAERPDLFTIESLADVDATTVELVGRRYRIGRLHTDYKNLLNDPIDAVVILSGGSHCLPAVHAAQAGKHLFVEKPLGENSAEVEQVAKAVQAAKVTLMVGYHKRYDPGYLQARETVSRLQDLRFARVDVLHPVDARARDHYVIEPQTPPERAALANHEKTDGLIGAVTNDATRARIEAIIGIGAPLSQQVATFLLFNSLIHDVNALRGILGEPEEVLYSDFWRDGRCMHTNIKWRDNLHVNMNWIYLPGLRNYKEELLFVSPESRVTINFPSPYYKHFPTPITIENMENGAYVKKEVIVSYEEAFRTELHHFYDCVARGETPHTGIEDARGDTRVLEAIARASR